MTEPELHNIACPHCGKEQDAGIYDAVIVQADPELRERLLEGRLNIVTCIHCEMTFRVESSLVYHDADRGFMVHCIPAPDSRHAALQEAFVSNMREVEGMLPEGVEPPKVHLVFSRVELIERICLLEMGLDERVLEYVKYLMYVRNGDRLPARTTRLLLDARDSTEDALYFVVQDMVSGKLEGMLEYDRKAYLALEEMFDHDESTPNLLELFPGPYISARSILLLEEDEGEVSD